MGLIFLTHLHITVIDKPLVLEPKVALPVSVLKNSENEGILDS